MRLTMVALFVFSATIASASWAESMASNANDTYFSSDGIRIKGLFELAVNIIPFCAVIFWPFVLTFDGSSKEIINTRKVHSIIFVDSCFIGSVMPIVKLRHDENIF